LQLQVLAHCSEVIANMQSSGRLNA